KFTRHTIPYLTIKKCICITEIGIQNLNSKNVHCLTLKHLYMCTISSTNNIKSVFDFVPRSVKHVHWYCCNCVKDT
ncbi:hypothetical protein L9F63_004716, partial [Diploptera punctata]